MRQQNSRGADNTVNHTTREAPDWNINTGKRVTKKMLAEGRSNKDRRSTRQQTMPPIKWKPALTKTREALHNTKIDVMRIFSIRQKQKPPDRHTDTC